jgi:hypothetical protein
MHNPLPRLGRAYGANPLHLLARRPTKTVGDQLFGRPVIFRRRQVRISASAVVSRWSA